MLASLKPTYSSGSPLRLQSLHGRPNLSGCLEADEQARELRAGYPAQITKTLIAPH